tara:strand:+ start:37381 stop:37776 length:396 start_codon:yes stop_codon:yes gene_type:complete
MKNSNTILFFSFLLIYSSCFAKKDSKERISSNIKSNADTVQNTVNIVDSLSIEYNNRAAELWPQLHPDRIPLALAYLDTALNIDSTNITAHSYKLTLLHLTDSVKARDYFFESSITDSSNYIIQDIQERKN